MNRIGWMLIAVAACNSSKPKAAAIPPADQQRITELVRAAQTKADAYAKVRELGLRTASRGHDPATATAPCPVTMPALPLIRGDDLAGSPEDRKAQDVARWRMTVVSESAVMGELPPSGEKMMQKIEREVATKGPRRDQFERQSKMLSRIVSDGTVPGAFKNVDEIVALANEIGSDGYWEWELNIVTTEHRHPMFNPSRFEAGAIVGKALLWSFKDGRVVCSANVTATNQDSMTLRIDPKEQQPQQHHVLNEDLKNQAFRAAISSLKAVPAPPG